MSVTVGVRKFRENLSQGGEADSVTCLSLGYLEMRSAIARRVARRMAVRAWARLDERWQEIETLAMSTMA